MLYVLYAIFFISCIVLIGSVLLQPGKTDAGALFTSNVSSAAFGPRGTASVLSKLTIVAAAFFMVSALLISMPALSGNVSVLQGNEETPAETESVAPADANSNVPDANTAVPETNTNSAAPAAAETNVNAVPANK